MSAVAAAPDELDAFVQTLRATTEQQRSLLRRLERDVDALGPDRRALGPYADATARELRVVVARSDALAAQVADTAAAFRAADLVLARLVGAGSSAAGDGGSGNGTSLPTPDVSVAWSWPPSWTIERRWGDDRAFAEVELGAGVRTDAGAGADVTRTSIRLGSFLESRVGAWAVGAVGTAIGPFAAGAGGDLFAGARARAEALLHIGRDGSRAHLGGELFAGAKAEGDAHAELGPIQAGAHGGVSYGVGLTGDADIDLSLERIGGRITLGGAWGLGFEGGLEYYVEPAWVADGLKDLGTDAFSIGSEAVDDVGDVAGGVVHAGGSVLRSVGGLF
jgi:hypothetical protein